MKNRPFLTFSLFVAFLLLFAPATPAQQPATVPIPTPPIQTGGEVAAMAAAEVWLGLVDDGQFEKCWDSGSKMLQGVVTKQDWLERANARRPQLGKVVSRKVTEAKPTENLPGAPTGVYVVIQYHTEFEHKKVALETVTMTMDGGQWKVSGYYIR